ncbi:unnamed protein product, partial [marine sediment metagenome]
TGVICPKCGNKTDQCPCLECGYQFDTDKEHKGVNEK